MSAQRSRRRAIALAWALLVLPALAARRPTPEEQTARRFEALRNHPAQLQVFLRAMPKGGDLHNHLAGAIYAESYLKFAATEGLCVERQTSTLREPPCDATHGKPPAAEAYNDAQLYAQLIDAFSMRHYDAGAESGHDHFFATFAKFQLAEPGNEAAMISEAREQGARDHLQYLELMITPEDGAAALGSKLGWNAKLSEFRAQLLSGGMSEVTARGSKEIDAALAKSDEILKCGSAQAEAGCGVMVRVLYQVLRGLRPEQVYAQILAGFELAKSDPRVVGLNLVMAEDAYIPMHDFNLHMQMLNFLAPLYPKVQITLHAGELTPKLVPPSGLFHIRASIEQGHARRIGHGVDVLYEPQPASLLREMVRRRVLVEICLTSNREILGVSGSEHPFPEYLRAGVPLALATDDEGVSRSDLTADFVTAVEDYRLTYPQLKRLVRNSLEYSFLPGPSLWRDDSYRRVNAACASDFPRLAAAGERCEKFLRSSEKARQQWRLEEALDTFEKQSY